MRDEELTIDVERGEGDAVERGDGGEEQGGGQAGVPEPFGLSSEDAGGYENVVSATRC